jgi:hypothetical protein
MCGLTKVGHKKRFAYAFSLCALAMIWLCLISPQEAVSGGKDWFGRVIVWETRSAECSGSKEEPDAKSSGECSDKLEAIAVLQYCSGWFYLEELKYLDVHKCSAQGTHRMKHCSRAPMESWDCKDLFITRNNKEEGRRFGDTLNVGSDGTYRLKVDGNIKATHYVFLNSTGNKNCAGDRYNLITCTDPYEGAKVGDVLSPKEVEAWEPVLAAAFRPNEPGTTIVKPLVGQVWSISFLANGRVGEKGNVIQNDTKLPPLKGGGTEPCHICGPAVKKGDKNDINPTKRRANWFLTTDPCEYVKKEHKEAVKIKETYKQMRDDPKTANMNGTAFNNYVKGKLTSDDLSPSAPMETHPDCPEPKKEDLEVTKENRYRCLPEIVFEADLEHEKVHQEKCKRLKTDKGEGAYWEYLQDKNNYANDDINAYNKKIEVLQNWLDKNCKNWRR